MFFQIIKFSDALFGIKLSTEIIFGDRQKIINYAVDSLEADFHSVMDVMSAFKNEDKNYADFGLMGTWTFISKDNVARYLEWNSKHRKGAA